MEKRVITSYIIVIAIYACLIPAAIILLGPKLDRLLGLPPFIPPPANIAAGLILLAYSWFWIVWSQIILTRSGEGHPNEILGHELGPLTRKLVTAGPYRYTRNPMAYGLILFYFAALPLLCNAISVLLLLPAACLFETWYHRRFEEPGLLKRFGSDYERYRGTVPLLFPFPKFRRRGYSEDGG